MAAITTLVSDLLQKMDEDAAAAGGRYMDTQRRQRRTAGDPRRWFSVPLPPPPADDGDTGQDSGGGDDDDEGDEGDEGEYGEEEDDRRGPHATTPVAGKDDDDGSGVDGDSKEQKYGPGPPHMQSSGRVDEASKGDSGGSSEDDRDDDDTNDAAAGALWRSVAPIKPWEAIDLYCNRMRALAGVTTRDLSLEINEAESYMLSHAHRFPMEDEKSTLALLDLVWLYLCHAYTKHSALRARVINITNSITQHNATAFGASETSRQIMEYELRRRILRFHRGGCTDYMSYVHTEYITSEETRRATYSRNEAARIRGERLASQSATDASANGGAAAASKVAPVVYQRNPDTLRWPTVPAEPGPDATIPGSLRHLFRSVLSERDFVLACAIELTRDAKLSATTHQTGAAIKPNDLTALKWSAQYAWSVMFKETLLSLHIFVDPQPAAVAHWRPYFRSRLLAQCEYDIKDSWKEYREWLIRLWTPAGFAIRSGRLEQTRRNESLPARVMNDVKLMLDNSKYPHVNGNLKTLMDVRLSTRAKQYCRTEGHPGQDPFLFFYFALLFKRDTRSDFMERYVMVGDCGVSDPLTTWRYVARRPRKLSTSPHLPLIVEYGGEIRVRMGNRVYACDTFVEAATTWCVLVHMYFCHDRSRPDCRLTEDGVDISPFLSRFLTNVRFNPDVHDTRGHVLAELAPDVYPYSTSDTEDEIEAAQSYLAIAARVNDTAAAAPLIPGDPGHDEGAAAATAMPLPADSELALLDRLLDMKDETVPHRPSPRALPVIGIKRERDDDDNKGDSDARARSRERRAKVPRFGFEPPSFSSAATRSPMPTPPPPPPPQSPPPPLLPPQLHSPPPPRRRDDGYGEYDPDFGARPPVPAPGEGDDAGDEDEGDGGRARRARNELWNAQRRQDQQRRRHLFAMAAPGAAAEEVATRLDRISAERRAQRLARRRAAQRSAANNNPGGGARTRSRSASMARASLVVSRQRELDSP